MSITDELREWVHASLVGLFSSGWERDLIAIADRIDKEHAEAVADALQLRGEPDRWVELPVDADGVPIHVGDVMEGLHGENANAKFLVLHEDGVWDVGDRGWVPSFLRHHQPDSWERIIHDAIAEGFERTDVSATCEVGNDVLVERCRRVAGS